MNFELSDDQRMLQDMLERSTDAVTAATIQELGLSLLPFAETDGGLGLGGVEMMLVGEAFGRGLVDEPYLGGVVMAGAALTVAPSSTERSTAIAALVSGTRRFALVDNPALVLGGDVAETLVVIDGDSLSLVDAATVSRRAFKLHNGWGAAAVDLAGAARDELGTMVDVATHASQAAIAWLAANAVGAMQAAIDLTIDYLKTREQFGKPIGSYQALQHRMAEMLVELEAARSMAMYATQMIAEPDAAERVRAFAAIKLVINKSARFIGQQAVQLHGGIGVAQEYAIGRYFKHLTVVEILFGDSDLHADALARCGGLTSAAPHWDS